MHEAEHKPAQRVLPHPPEPGSTGSNPTPAIALVIDFVFGETHVVLNLIFFKCLEIKNKNKIELALGHI